ncbi:Isoleucyl-tRNA synthetase [Fibrobacter sp. UWH5]|uniref:isoleucine--tRNA ligase n=1 Tax=Fibrobacter sp. UWH5 TaxID=1896211 RepID=UPI00091674DD|nr:isoleucine--tRNA ligase [Fibrobacter sp. UWH5]SHK68401.1 Isoleucyl-tRNA synthetase [Fibrobacter sp. UWH5]
MAKLFREVQKEETFPQIEERVLGLWDKDDSFKKSLDSRPETAPYTFYDGPPFATGLPHYGHLLAGTIKDIVPRYWTMKGKKVPRGFGWDCHGLPIESLVQNELGLAGVAEIQNLGVDKFNETCRSKVLKYTGEWRKTVRRMGRWVDFDKGYKTMDKNFMESVWWVFKQCFDKGLIYQGYRIQPYSPALATPLSNFETNQGYKDRQDPSLTLIFPLVSDDAKFAGSNILVWTTTPWTLPSNFAIAVKADAEYVCVEQDGKKFWVMGTRAGAYFKQPNIVDKCMGSDLAGLKYEALFHISDAYATPEELAKRYTIYVADFVSDEDGAGAVHIAPSFGEEDFQLGASLGLGLFDPLDTEGKFTDKVPMWQGLGAKEADKSIIAYLKEQGRVFKHETFVHSYPHCWRTGVPLLYRALKTWFLKIDGEVTNAEGVTKTLKEWMVENNQTVNWVPDHIKSGRFGKWIANARDWNLSRNRFWGTPIPVWIADDGEMIAVGSIKELADLTGETLDDLHKHFVDKIVIKKDGKEFKRTPEVFDCWFESGSMPYASRHYPFENKELVEKSFPADFIAEGLDQTRGWFYTLTVLSNALFQKPAFKNVIVNGIILAEDGSKMSKSKKNYPDPNELIERTGADAIRLFLINSAALKAEDLRFSEEGVKGIVKQVMLPLWNAVSFFVSNHNADAAKGQLNWKPGQEVKSENELDRWMLATLQDLAAKVEVEMKAYRLYNVVPAIIAAVDDLTNWYVRRSRRRFWKSENDGDKNAAYATMYKVLVDFSKILAPFLPLLAEEIYQILVREVDANAPVSVHLCEFPSADESLKDEALVQRIAMVRGMVEMGRAIRATNNVKNRMPIASMTVVPHGAVEKDVAETMKDLILEELNVREMKFLEDETVLVKLTAKPNFLGIKAKGPEYAKNMKVISAKLNSLSADEIKALQGGETIKFEFGEVGADCLMIQRIVPEGLAVDADSHFTVALDLNVTDELRRACVARELVNRIQNRRKEQNYTITDKIEVTLFSESEMFKQAVAENEAYIAGETQATAIKWAATADGLEKNDADGEEFSFTTVKA